MKELRHIIGTIGLTFLLSYSAAKADKIKPNTLPENPNLINGEATIYSSANNLAIEQKTDKISINWDTFNIGSSAIVEFFQPNNKSVALNRVNSSDPSYIYGDLRANGQLIFINPSGVLFKGGSKVDVGAMIATTLNMSDDHFLNGNYTFKDQNDTGRIVNEGNIKAKNGGTIALIARSVVNKGLIETPEGSSALISNNDVTLTMIDNALINFEINSKELENIVKEKNAINVNNNEILLTSNGKNEVFNAVVNNEGTIKANSISRKGGKIFLSSRKGKIKNSGTMMASSNATDGGYIEVTSDDIEVDKGSRILAQGSNKGGKILIGGSWQLTLLKKCLENLIYVLLQIRKVKTFLKFWGQKM